MARRELPFMIERSLRGRIGDIESVAPSYRSGPRYEKRVIEFFLAYMALQRKYLFPGEVREAYNELKDDWPELYDVAEQARRQEIRKRRYLRSHGSLPLHSPAPA